MNILDTFLVAYGLLEGVGVNLSFLRALRVFKLAKVIRVLKALKQVRDLRLMLDCLISSWFALFWAIVLIAFITYMFALIFVQMMTDFMIDQTGTVDPDLQDFFTFKFGSVQQGIVSLLKIFFGGIDWGDMFDVMLSIGPIPSFISLVFVVLFTVSVWNIVGSIFIEKVMQTAQPSPREIMEENRTQEKLDALEMKSYLYLLDTDGDRTLNKTEFERMIETEGLGEFMAERDVALRDTADVKAFFNLAQHEYRSKHPNSTCERIPMDAFVSTFEKMKGRGTSLQVATLLELRSLRESLSLAGTGVSEKAIQIKTAPCPCPEDKFDEVLPNCPS
jgi:hypothetical protein